MKNWKEIGKQGDTNRIATKSFIVGHVILIAIARKRATGDGLITK
jgi:hypothetical protein